MNDMKYSIRQNHLNKIMLFEDGIQVGEPNAPELEFWARIQELETKNKPSESFIKLIEQRSRLQDKVLILERALAEKEERINRLVHEVATWGELLKKNK